MIDIMIIIEIDDKIRKIFLINYKKVYKRNECLIINNLINRSFKLKEI